MAHTRSVLIIGGSGFIGTHLALKLRAGYKVFATYNRHRIFLPGVTTLPASLFNRDWAKRITYLARPDFVIYAAGTNNVEWCEAHARDAEQLHTSGAATISNLSEIFQPNFIYLSNSYVFDGSKGNYHEGDIVLPSTSLGKAKLGGENFIRSKALSFSIIRSAPVLGRGNGVTPNFLDRLRIRLTRGEKCELANDELHNFAPVEGLVEIIQKVMETNARKKTFHYGGLTKITPYEFGLAFAKRFKLDPGLVIPVRSSYHGSSTGERIRQDYSLNSSAAVESLKFKPLFLEESLDLIDKNLIPRS
ncbi:MAG TPA: hypothetical protein DCS07_02435 [Bdellovibrionales bacterium]|nr:MAG: hypothetical protein A2Z97_01700 [Bdellovibrionales bacterium GWB1_52_6]OFZ04935.1 MAG: hypothetical protein A2X97_16370 [Bdellovibrionales bacterium GWA1_52_35]OFZ34619.1 MAG: hypothetical protein A2070_11480 [Bdellovibrionales bacterium GWC1_52_8]HAR41482.1 hypothetical protein [Bdellovibrionales bacterium]HCM38872.1 hypothetical protein [Bdellovibrionales bacterium]